MLRWIIISTLNRRYSTHFSDLNSYPDDAKPARVSCVKLSCFAKKVTVTYFRDRQKTPRVTYFDMTLLSATANYRCLGRHYGARCLPATISSKTTDKCSSVCIEFFFFNDMFQLLNYNVLLVEILLTIRHYRFYSAFFIGIFQEFFVVWLFSF